MRWCAVLERESLSFYPFCNSPIDPNGLISNQSDESKRNFMRNKTCTTPFNITVTTKNKNQEWMYRWNTGGTHSLSQTPQPLHISQEVYYEEIN